MFRVIAGGRRVLLCGDAGEQELDEALRGGRGLADIVVLPRHGGRIDDVATFIARIRPRLAIASGRESGVHAETICAVQDSGVPVALTWATGCVEVSASGSGIAVGGFAGRPPHPSLPRRTEPVGPGFPALQPERLSAVPDADDGLHGAAPPVPPAPRRTGRPSRAAMGTDEDRPRRAGGRRPASPAREAEGGAAPGG